MSGTQNRSEDHSYSTLVHQHSLSTPSDLYYPAGTAGFTSSISEHCTDGWRKLIANGSVIMSAMDRGKWERTASSGNAVESAPQFGVHETYDGDFAGLVRNAIPSVPLNPTAHLISRAKANAVLDAFAKANGSESFAGETIAQMGETVRMLRRPLGGAYKLTQKVIKDYKRRYRRHLLYVPEAQVMANAWLEYRYGWKPLIMDLELIMNSIVGLHQQLKRRVVVRGSAREPDVIQDYPYSTKLAGNFSRWTASGVVTRSEKIRAHAGVIIDIEPMSTLDMVMKVFGFRGRDLPTTLWALTPLSFVVDWFSNVEKWLTAVIPDPSVIYRGSWVTSVNEVTLDFSGGTINGDPLYYTIPSSGAVGSYSPSFEKHTRIVREPNPSLPSTPVLTSGILSLVRQVDAASLLVGSINTNLKEIGTTMRKH